MLIEIDVDPSHGVARIRILGPIDPTRFVDAANQLLDHPGFRPGMAAIYDLRDADLGALKAEDVRAMAGLNQLMAERRGEARIALVVSQDLSFGMMRMYEVLGVSSNLDVSVFRRLDEAEEWVIGSAQSDREGDAKATASDAE